MPHSVLSFAFVYKAVGIAHDVFGRITIGAKRETEQIARRLAHDVLQLDNGLLDPVDSVLDQKAVVRAADQIQLARARSRGA